MIIYVLYFIYITFWLYSGIIFLSVIFSWITPIQETKFGMLIRDCSNWFLKPFRGLLVFGFLDFTPMIGIVIFEVIQRFLGSLIIA